MPIGPDPYPTPLWATFEALRKARRDLEAKGITVVIIDPTRGAYPRPHTYVDTTRSTNEYILPASMRTIDVLVEHEEPLPPGAKKSRVPRFVQDMTKREQRRRGRK